MAACYASAKILNAKDYTWMLMDARNSLYVIKIQEILHNLNNLRSIYN